MIDLRTIYPVNEAILKFLYDLLQEREDHVSISHKTMPSWDDHVNFVCSMPYRYWWIIFGEIPPIDGMRQVPRNVGAAYLSKQNEIGIFIKKEYQGKGYGKEAIKRIVEMFPGQRLLANISPANERSHKLFQELGFSPIQTTYELAS